MFHHCIANSILQIVCRYKSRFGFAEDSFDTDKVTKALSEEIFPRHLHNLEKILAASESGWLAGTLEPTIADFFLVPSLEWLQNGCNTEGISKTLLVQCPHICRLIQKFHEIPSVRKYYSDKK